MIAAKDLAVGSIVRLASGSPKLIVTSLSTVNNRDILVVARVMWFSSLGELHEAEILNTFLSWPKPAQPTATVLDEAA